MLGAAEKIIFVLIIIVTAAAFLAPLVYRYKILRSARPEARFDHFLARLSHALGKIVFQRCTLKNERVLTGFMHVFIFYGALTFDTMTVNHTLEGLFPNFYIFGKSGFGLFFSSAVDVFAILVLIGILFFAVRRFIVRPKAYATARADSAVIYLAIVLVTLSYLYFEAFAIGLHPETSRWAFLGGYLAQAIKASGLSASALAAHFKISWWLHILFVFGFIAYVPHSKYLHMFTGSFNMLVRSPRSGRALDPLDLEKSEVFGIEKALDYTWKDHLDAFACMECGRCQDVCPAYASEKPLSPKMILVNMERHLLKDGRALMARKREDSPCLVPAIHSPDEIWTCTTCGACMHACPVEIEHIRKIVGMRQSQVLMESKFPPELNAFFRNMETNSNPWGIGFSKRADWTEDLPVKLIRDHPEAQYLLWVGCAGSFDEEGKKISRALAALLTAAGLDFAVLGAEEKCCGDSARRLGHEYLFQTLAGENLAVFARYNVRKILTFCPHGYNTFKNEYPALLELLPSLSSEDKARLQKIEVFHHTEILQSLIRLGRLPGLGGSEGRLAYHDPCYLGRHNGILEAPRDILSGLGSSRFIELKNSRNHSFCCGAGGGLMWTEEKLGKRINHLRVQDVMDAGTETVATACPFCLTMLRDGLKDKDKAEIKVQDIAQLLAERLEA